MNLKARLKEATQDPILSELKGSEGLFAITPRELIYVGTEGVQRAPLAEIRRVASAKGGILRIAGKETTFIEASVAGFDFGELKLFFESVKGYVTKARRGELPPEPAEPAEPAKTPPAPESPPSPEAGPEEKTLETLPTEESPPVVPEEEEAEKAPMPPEPTPAPAEAPAPRRTSPLRLPLKLLALLTWGFTGAALYLYPGLDPLWMAGLLLGGIGLGLLEWRVADL